MKEIKMIFHWVFMLAAIGVGIVAVCFAIFGLLSIF